MWLHVGGMLADSRMFAPVQRAHAPDKTIATTVSKVCFRDSLGWAIARLRS
jgi:hypothetical protein